MGISEVILVPLPKGLCVRGWHLFHVVAYRRKFASNVMRRHPSFDTDKTGRQVREPQCNAPTWDLLSQHDAAAGIKANHVKRVLAHIYSDGGHCVNGGRTRHGGAPYPGKPPRTLRAIGGGSAAGPSHSLRLMRRSEMSHVG